MGEPVRRVVQRPVARRAAEHRGARVTHRGEAHHRGLANRVQHLPSTFSTGRAHTHRIRGHHYRQQTTRPRIVPGPPTGSPSTGSRALRCDLRMVVGASPRTRGVPQSIAAAVWVGARSTEQPSKCYWGISSRYGGRSSGDCPNCCGLGRSGLPCSARCDAAASGAIPGVRLASFKRSLAVLVLANT